MSAENKIVDPKFINLGFNEGNDPLAEVEGVVRVEEENVGPLITNSRASSIGTEPRTPGAPSAFNLRIAPTAVQSVAKKALSLQPTPEIVPEPKHITPAPIRRFLSTVKSELGIKAKKPVNIKTLISHPLYQKYNSYLNDPTNAKLLNLKTSIAKAGFTNPVVQTLQLLVEEQKEKSTFNTTLNSRALDKLIGALGARYSSDGGKRRTRKQKRKAKPSRKHRLSRRK
jgi:hypothetical protein